MSIDWLEWTDFVPVRYRWQREHRLFQHHDNARWRISVVKQMELREKCDRRVLHFPLPPRDCSIYPPHTSIPGCRNEECRDAYSKQRDHCLLSIDLRVCLSCTYFSQWNYNSRSRSAENSTRSAWEREDCLCVVRRPANDFRRWSNLRTDNVDAYRKQPSRSSTFLWGVSV